MDAALAIAVSLALVAGDGDATRSAPSAAPPPAQAVRDSAMTDPSFARADTLLAQSARRWRPAAKQTPGPQGWWRSDVAGFREYTSDDETTVVEVYRFSNTRDAASGQQEMATALRTAPVDGARLQVMRNGEFVFRVQGAVVPPNHPRAAAASATFAAVIAALRRHAAP